MFVCRIVTWWQVGLGWNGLGTLQTIVCLIFTFATAWGLTYFIGPDWEDICGALRIPVALAQVLADIDIEDAVCNLVSFPRLIYSNLPFPFSQMDDELHSVIGSCLGKASPSLSRNDVVTFSSTIFDHLKVRLSTLYRERWMHTFLYRARRSHWLRGGSAMRYGACSI